MKLDKVVAKTVIDNMIKDFNDDMLKVIAVSIIVRFMMEYEECINKEGSQA